ncbi:MAG: hemolysin family protein, partial [Phycisphaerae bacterium]|nr:hemolysin family protein [Phycisphaerae bacterium]
VDPQETQMIKSVLEFQDTRADQIMTPRTDIIAVDVTADLHAVLETVHQAGHSRIPVYEGNLDNIIGLLYAKDLLWEIARDGDESGPPVLAIRKVMRPPLFVPESRSLSDLLGDLRRTHVHLAIVLDEFGGTAGLVTIEDILEEIVGEIADEHEQPEQSPIRKLDERTWEVDGRVHVDDLNEQLKLTLPENEDYDTISGFVISSLGRIPKTGEALALARSGVTITIAHAEPRRIVRLRLQLTPATSDAEA